MSAPVSLLERLISVDTHNPGGDERALAEVLAGELAGRGADAVELVDVPRPRGGGRGAYVLARWGTPRLLVNAHLDTVPPNAGWTADPYRARVEDGRVLGLGAADTKGAIAAIVSALDDARPRDTAILFSGDEEVGGSVMTAFLATPLARELAQAIVCEPTSCRAGTRHRGFASIELRVAGDGGHSSMADRLPAPIVDLARAAVAWHDWARARRDEGPPAFTGTCLNVAGIDGGVAVNVVPEAARLYASLRPAPGTDSRALLGELRALAGEHAPGAVFEVLLDNPPLATRAPAAFRRWLGDVVDAPIDLGFWTEAAWLTAAGIDAVVYGPGDIAQAHAADEWVAVSDLERARTAFATAFAATG